MFGLALTLGVYGFVLVLHLVVPGRWVDGYVRDPSTGKPLRYRLNGLRVFLITLGSWFAATKLGWIAADVFWVHRWETLITACVLGLIFSAAIVFTAPSTGKNVLADFYLGRRPNPQLWGGRLDAKMWLYLIGATMLGLNLWSFVAAHQAMFEGDAAPGVVVSTALFSFFLVEYLFFEEVHLYTYDFMAENVGFKLGWGCLTFYPFFYAVGLWNRVDQPNPHAPTWLLAFAVVLFFSGWTLSRGANLQKFHFKRDPTRAFLGIVPEALEGRVLVNGFWGLSRHVNYLGELLMASGITLALGAPGHWAPWLYPLYYVVLLFPRQADDDRRCAQKYGALWPEYVRRVPRKIVPFLY